MEPLTDGVGGVNLMPELAKTDLLVRTDSINLPSLLRFSFLFFLTGNRTLQLDFFDSERNGQDRAPAKGDCAEGG